MLKGIGVSGGYGMGHAVVVKRADLSYVKKKNVIPIQSTGVFRKRLNVFIIGIRSLRNL